MGNVINQKCRITLEVLPGQAVQRDCMVICRMPVCDGSSTESPGWGKPAMKPVTELQTRNDMQIDRESLICGAKPVRLKALMRNDRFITPTAMVLLKLPEPQISETLTQLATAGWISWEGTR